MVCSVYMIYRINFLNFISLDILGKMNDIWYDSLEKSPLTPPNYVFTSVWLLLYTLMVVSFIRIIYRSAYGLPLLLFVSQIILNVLWVSKFFTYHNIPLSLVIIILLLIVVIIMTYSFYTYDNIAGLIQLPYILWLLFAIYLNWYIYKHMNVSVHKSM